MPDRRSFLGAVSGAAASALLASQADAQAPAPEAPPASSPLPTPAPSASAKRPSALAAATAAAMRAYDGSLTQKDVDTIAQGINANRKGAAALNPNRGRGLRNSDEPATRFAAPRPR